MGEDVDMPSPHRLLPQALTCAVLILSGGACGAPPEPSSAVLWREIQAELAELGCDGPQQCHSIGLGSKACGGPESYSAWSSRRNDGARLRQLVARHAAARRDEDARAGMMSTCSIVADPGATCRAGRCELQPPGLGGNTQQ